MGRVQSSLVLNDQMSKVLGRINKAMGSVLDSFEAVQRASGRSFNTANIAAARREIGAADAALNEMEQSYRDCNNQQQQLNRHIGQGTAAAGGLLGKIKGVASAYLGMKAVKGLVGLSDTITQTDARLSIMNDGLQTTAELNNMIYASAQRSRGSYLATADAVAKLGLMAGDAFSGNKETIAFMEQVNKQFKIAGTSAQGIDAAMLQLTQAMGSGVLRGEEYNSILEQAPNIIQAIAKYMDVPKGQLKEMAADGKITADIVKAAMFACADETNAKFESMPKTWSDIWTSMKNKAIKALDPVLAKINQLANSERVQRTVNGLLRAFSVMAVVLAQVFDGVCAVYNFVADNWSWISPIVMGIVGALLLYKAAVSTISAIETVASVAKGVFAAATALLTGTTFAATVAQYGLNTAMYACPITWLIVIIIALIALFYVVIAAINKVCGTSISATGIIMGSLAAVGAFLFNMIAGIWNVISAFIEFFVNVWKHPEYAIKAFIVNIINANLNFCMAMIQGNGAAVGAIVGSWFMFRQIMLNIIAAVKNFFAMCVENVVNNWRTGVYLVQTVVYKIADAALGVAQSVSSSMEAVATNIGNAFVSGANAAIKAINWIIDAINHIPGINIGKFNEVGAVKFNKASNALANVRNNFQKPSAPETFSLGRTEYGSFSDAYSMGNQVGQKLAARIEGSVAKVQNGLQNWLGETPEDYWTAPKLNYINLGDAAKAGYNFGAGTENKIAGIGGMDPYSGALGDIAKNTGDTAKGVGKSTEEFSYLRDIAERDAINRFTTAEIKVDLGGVTNNVAANADLDGIISYLTDGVAEALVTASEGVY